MISRKFSVKDRNVEAVWRTRILFSMLLTCQLGLAQQVLSLSDTLELPTIVVTAQFTPTDSRETVNTVRIIDHNTIERKGATNLLELLQSEVNLRVSHDAILGSGLSINGLQSENVKILVDGVPVIGRLNGGIDLTQLPLQNVRQVEIIEGAQSLLYGSAASAGVVNLVTKGSQIYKVQTDLSSSVESNGYQRLQAMAGVDWGAPSISLSGGLINFDPKAGGSTRDQLWNPKRQKNARASLGYSTGDKMNLKATISHMDEEVKNLGEIRRPDYKPYSLDDYYSTIRTDYSVHAEYWLKKNLYWQTTGASNDYKRIKNSYRLDIEEGGSELVEGQQDSARARGRLFRSTVASDDRDRKWNYLIGLEYYRERAEDARISSPEVSEEGTASITDLGVFGSVKYVLSKELLFQSGLRGISNSRYGEALTPSIWLSWKPSKQFDLKASYARGFRSPSLKELYFNFVDINHFILGSGDLLPEYSHNLRVDVSRSQELNSGWSLKASTSAFYNAINNRIVLAEYDVSKFSYQNLEQWKSSGAGIELSVRKGKKFKVRSNFIYTGYYNDISGEDKISELLWSADWANELSIDLCKETSLTIWHKYTGKTPYYFLQDDETIRGEAGDWHLINISANTQWFQNRVHLTTGIKNILDVTEIKSSRASGGAHAGQSGTSPVHWGRSFFVELKVKLHSKK